MINNNKTNVLFILVDQLCASALPLYGEKQISTPNIDRLASEGVTLTNAVSSCPVCTPYRSMLLTGRHPQTTGLVVNSLCMRHSEISIADAFAHNGYRTGWIGKWHLHSGAWPANNVPDWVPEGRDRLGFEYWKGYNQHMVYFDGYVNGDDWNTEQWEGYEPFGLNKFAFDFLDKNKDEPFCLFISPQPPHWTPYQFAPEKYYEKLPAKLELPANVPDCVKEKSLEAHRHYLAMILAIDDSVGEIIDYLDENKLTDNTLVVFASDHGTQLGAHGIGHWQKRSPYEESLNVPFIMRLPGRLEQGVKCDALTSPVDIFPSLCGLCNIPVPRSVEGYDLSKRWIGEPDAFEQEGILTMNFSNLTGCHDHHAGGNEWRGVRTKRYSYAKWLNGNEELYDLEQDRLQMNNVVNDDNYSLVYGALKKIMEELQDKRCDELIPCETYKEWVDNKRRIIRNAYGPLSDPESIPDWSLLHR